MLKKTLTYTDFDGVTRTKDFYFNLTQAETVEFVSKYPEDFKAYVVEIANEPTKERLVDLFKRLIMMSYGKRIGDDFVKSAEASEAFTHTEAYSVLFMGIFSSEQNMIAFFSGLLNVDIQKIVEESK